MRSTEYCLQGFFQCLLGFPLKALDPDGDFNLLRPLGNATRHGDGHVAQTVLDLCSELWITWLASGSSVVVNGKVIRVQMTALAHPALGDISFPPELHE